MLRKNARRWGITMKLIGIDIGTTTISGVVLDKEAGAVIASKTVDNGSFIETSRAWEKIQEVSVMVARAKEILDELLAQHPDVSAIGLTGQMHGILYTDSGGRCVSPLYTWQDGRGGLPVNADAADNTVLAEEVRRKTGMEIAAGYGLLTHLYNQRHGEVPEGAASICTVSDYFGMVLTGQRHPLMHVSNAASLGFFDCERLRFDREALQRLDMDGAQLPEVTADFAVLGQYRGIPVGVALGDNQASFLGSAGFQKNVLLVNMGTGGQISMMTDYYVQIPGIETRPFNKETYLLVGASLCGGRAYAILETFFRSYAAAFSGQEVPPQYEVMERLARSEQENTLNVSTLFAGSRAEPELRGNITNICEDNFTPGQLICGVMRGMARELYEMYRKIADSTGSRAELLIASGNGLRKNMLLRDIFSEMFQAELRLARFEEEAACGAALAAEDLYPHGYTKKDF